MQHHRLGTLRFISSPIFVLVDAPFSFFLFLSIGFCQSLDCLHRHVVARRKLAIGSVDRVAGCAESLGRPMVCLEAYLIHLY
jgi:hypothetical protein